MFGLSFGELVVLLLVAVVVLGPKEMPRYLRKAGEMAGRLRRMAYDMRAKSGIDEVLRGEGIGADIAEIRRLANFARGELTDIVSSVRSAANGASLPQATARPLATPPPYAAPALPPAPGVVAAAAVAVDREREYPTGGADAYGALPEGTTVYDGQLPSSPLAVDPLYARGDDVQAMAATKTPADGPAGDEAGQKEPPGAVEESAATAEAGP